MTTPHTVGPWKIRIPITGTAWRVYTEEGTYVASCSDKQTAENIISNHNAHEAMVEAIRKVCHLIPEKTLRADFGLEQACKAALALAEGKQP